MSDTLPVTDCTLSPTDLSQYARLDNCERYLRLRLHERSAGRGFWQTTTAKPQRISPLLTRAGAAFEQGLEARLRESFSVRNFAQESETPVGRRAADNAKLCTAIAALPNSGTLVITQPRLEARLGVWNVRGDIDLLHLARGGTGHLSVLIADIKSSARAKVEHRLQVAFYQAILAALLGSPLAPNNRGTVRSQTPPELGAGGHSFHLGVLYRGGAEESEAELALAETHRQAAHEWLGLDEALLEIVADPDAYAHEIKALVTQPGSVAERIAFAPFDSLHFSLSSKCDGCLYGEFCLKDAHDRQDLSLIPYLASGEKKALRMVGVTTTTALAQIKAPVLDTDGKHTGTLATEPGQEETARRLIVSSAGPRLEELIVRARQLTRTLPTLSYIPGAGHPSLPHTSATQNPNLVCVYLNVVHDYLQNRVGMLGARIVAYEQGVPGKTETIVHLPESSCDTPEKEEALLAGWIAATLTAIVELAAPDAEGLPNAPIHVIFWNATEQRQLLESIARGFPKLGKIGSALYDFVTQIAAFDSPVSSFLEEEIKRHKNYPILCPSLQNVASYLKFSWNSDHKQIFRERLFDGAARDGETGEYRPGRPRFHSQIPLEYAYAAWNELEPPQKDDKFAPFRAASRESLIAFQAERIEAMAHIAGDLGGNPYTEKRPFALPDLAKFTTPPGALADALHEFVVLERHASLGAWKSLRNQPAERRAAQGETLAVSFHAEDQDGEEPLEAAKPGAVFTLRLRADGAEADLETVLGLGEFEEGKRFIFYPRIAYDGRLPEAERKPQQPTPKQMLYGQRIEILEQNYERHNDKIIGGTLLVKVCSSMGNKYMTGFAFASAHEGTLTDGLPYTLDDDPNNIYGYWNLKVADGLRTLEREGKTDLHTLYTRLTRTTSAQSISDAEPFAAGQARFLAGLDALEKIGALHGFEPSKRAYIGAHGLDPILLVQGPPGTGKSYSSAFAVFARMQGAWDAGRAEFRVFLSCKTHKATDVLLKGMADAQAEFRKWALAYPALWKQYFDPRLLDVPLLRVAPKEVLPDGIRAIGKDKDAYTQLSALPFVIVGATPGGIYALTNARFPNKLFGHGLCDLLVLDEASQLSLPEAMMAALPLRPDAPLIVVGDPRQMPPIVQHDWKAEARRTFRQFRAYESLFEALGQLPLPWIKFEESFRLHQTMAGFLHQEVYRHDGIHYHSLRTKGLEGFAPVEALARAALLPDYPLVVIVHDEQTSQKRNAFEEGLIVPILRALAENPGSPLEAGKGFGVVVPHKAQRLSLRRAYPAVSDAVDTVERYQGDEREVIIVSATESDPDYLRQAAGFLLDPRRLTVALSRAKKKMILVASRSVFDFFSIDDELFSHSQMWKNLLRRACPASLWNGEIDTIPVHVWGGKSAD